MTFFNDVLAALGKKLNYESISNLYGNSFAKNAGKAIQAAYPLLHKDTKGVNGFAKLMNQTKIIKMPKTSTIQDKKSAEQDIFGGEWADGLFD